ncbi:MAG: permease, partial [Bacteroidetes bacterium]|nr:permease [Bacteroidota bacterium]
MSSAWVLRMAWWESRGSRRRLLIFLFSMVVGVALLVALSSTSDSLRYSIDQQARELLGADMRFSANRPFDDSTQAAIDTIGIARAQRISTVSIAYFPAQNQSRLIAVYAVEDQYPLYGALQSDPEEAGVEFRESSGALVDQGLMRTFGVHKGDSVQIGR